MQKPIITKMEFEGVLNDILLKSTKPSERVLIRRIIDHLEKGAIPKVDTLQNLENMVITQKAYLALDANKLIELFEQEGSIAERVNYVLGTDKALIDLHTQLETIYFKGLTTKKKEASKKDLEHINRVVANHLVKGIVGNTYFVIDDILGKNKKDFDSKCENVRKLTEKLFKIYLKIQVSGDFQEELRKEGMFTFLSVGA